jgi:hypothetical protein
MARKLQKRAKGYASLRSYHSTVDCLFILRIIVEECHNSKTSLLCFFVDFKKDFDTMPRSNLWNALEELKVPFELKVVVVRLCDNVIVNFRNTKGWSKEISCNIGVKKGC